MYAPKQFREERRDVLLSAIGIVGLALHVDRLEGTWKMIQHHPEANRIGVIDGLASTQEPTAMAVANVMRGLEHGRAAR